MKMRFDGGRALSRPRPRRSGASSVVIGRGELEKVMVHSSDNRITYVTEVDTEPLLNGLTVTVERHNFVGSAKK